jgi:hypothetical protein
MRRLTALFALLAGFMFTALTSASPLTTIFGDNRPTGEGVAIYFDVLVGSVPITVTGFDTNTDSQDPFEMAVYRTAPGSTAFGNETDQSAWVVVATGAGTGAGTNQPSAVALSDFFTLQSDTTYGIALVFTSQTLHRFTGSFGDEPFDIYSNSDLTITTGTATQNPFTGFVRSPRVWNGSIYYTADSTEGAIPEPSTISMMLLAGGLAMLVSRRKSRSRNWRPGVEGQSQAD